MDVVPLDIWGSFEGPHSRINFLVQEQLRKRGLGREPNKPSFVEQKKPFFIHPLRLLLLLIIVCLFVCLFVGLFVCNC